MFDHMVALQQKINFDGSQAEGELGIALPNPHHYASGSLAEILIGFSVTGLSTRELCLSAPH